MTTPKKPTTRKTPVRRKPRPVQTVDTPEGKVVHVHFGFKASDGKKVAWTFVQTFFGTFTAGSGAAALHSLSEAKVAAFSGAAAGVAAAISAAKNFILADDSALK